MVGRTRSLQALVVVGLMAGCTSAASPALPTGSPGTSPALPVIDRTVSDLDNTQRVEVTVGARVTLVLHSTYWQIQGSSDPAVLNWVAGPSVAPAGPTACVPGGGCGTVSAVFDAVAPGTARITASRTTCGEALLCTGSTGAYEVTIDVGG